MRNFRRQSRKRGPKSRKDRHRKKERELKKTSKRTWARSMFYSAKKLGGQGRKLQVR